MIVVDKSAILHDTPNGDVLRLDKQAASAMCCWLSQSVLVQTIALNHLLLSDQHLPLDPVDAPHRPPEHLSELYDQHDHGRVQLQHTTAQYIYTVLVTMERESRLYVHTYLVESGEPVDRPREAQQQIESKRDEVGREGQQQTLSYKHLAFSTERDESPVHHDVPREGVQGVDRGRHRDHGGHVGDRVAQTGCGSEPNGRESRKIFADIKCNGHPGDEVRTATELNRALPDAEPTENDRMGECQAFPVYIAVTLMMCNSTHMNGSEANTAISTIAWSW